MQRTCSGTDLRDMRQAAGLSRRQVAERVGVSPTRIANVEGSIAVAETFARRVRAAIADLAGEVVRR